MDLRTSRGTECERTQSNAIEIRAYSFSPAVGLPAYRLCESSKPSGFTAVTVILVVIEVATLSRPRYGRAMQPSTDPDLRARNVITSASSEGLVAIINGTTELRRWNTVTAVGATIVEHTGAQILVLSIAFDDTRNFVVGEVEPGWTSIVEHLHVSLPGVEPFTSWAPKLIESVDRRATGTP